MNNAILNHLGEGMARGVPSARLSVYNACTSEACDSGSVLAAIDGIDMISISIGSSSYHNYLNDIIAIGSFHAMVNGVVTSASAGNSGHSPASVINVAPWLMSISASSIYGKFTAKVVLGTKFTQSYIVSDLHI